MTREIACACGTVRLEIRGDPIVSAECYCNSCRAAAARIAALPGAAGILNPAGGTRFVLFRKDRVRILAAADRIRTFTLTPEASTKRAVATCCNTPVWLEFKGGHWLSLYGALWPEGTLPPLEVRTMTKDLPDPSVLPDDGLNARSQTMGFFWRLFRAWAAMGFRNPKTAEIEGELDV